MAIPAPVLVLAAPTWSWIVVANVFLGINQGLAWSTTVIMKIDLVGPRRRGLAMGLNEFAGYLAVAAAAFASGALAVQWGPRASVGWLTAGVALLGLVLSVAFVRDTTRHARLEQASVPVAAAPVSLRTLLRRSTWSDARLFSLSQAGFVNNHPGDDRSGRIAEIPPEPIDPDRSGTIADAFGLTWAIESVALLTAASGVVVAIRLREAPKP